jgi:hypothetical protein
MEFEAIQKFMGDILKALNMTINSKNIISKLDNAVDQLIGIIKNELKNKIFSVKIDCATRYNKSVLGVNAQFIKEKKIVIRNHRRL